MKLTDFLGGISEAGLRCAMADGQILHCRSASGVVPDTSFDFAALDQLISRLPEPAAHLRIVMRGRDIDPKSARFIDADGRLRPLALRGLLRQGAGVVVNKIHHHVPALWDLTVDAERRLGDRTSMAAVASYGPEAALPLHFDRSDVIVLQIEGSKLWHFHGTPVAGSAMSMRPPVEAFKDITSTVMLHPGDVLFVPQGQYHVCEAQGVSLHLSLLVNHINLAEYVGDRLATLAELNVPVRPYVGPEALAAQQALLRAALVDLAATIDLAPWLAAKNAEHARASAVPGLALDAGVPGATASFATSLPPALRRDGMIAAAGAAVRATPALLAMLDAIGMEPRPVAELVARVGQSVGGDDARAALHQLVNVGLVKIEIQKARPKR
ncbi:MAG: cupin domain-containing protein [Sphingomonas sp.]|jgi:hypothetical protein|uniref:JmjC domain-containing protein n=1 Tax=Sphingomonas sp. TaxID=28214 RepID=UPI003566F37E